MGFWIYLLIGFVIFFFMYKKYWHVMLERKKTYDAWPEYKEFWIVALTSVFWPLTLPGYIIWQLLEKLYNKFN